MHAGTSALASGVKRAGTTLKRAPTHVAGLVAQERKSPDNLTSLFKTNVAPTAAAAIAGALDNSVIGQAVHEATGFLDPSDLLFAAGVVVRGLGLDHNFVTARKANTVFMQQQVIHYGRFVGGNLPGAISAFISRKDGSKRPLAGVESTELARPASPSATASITKPDVAAPVKAAASANGHANGTLTQV